MRKIITCLTLMLALTAAAERGSKMSAFLQRYAASHQQAATRAAESGAQPCIMAFVKTALGIGGQLLGKYGSTVLTSSGDIYIAVIPASQLQALAAASTRRSTIPTISMAMDRSTPTRACSTFSASRPSKVSASGSLRVSPSAGRAACSTPTVSLKAPPSPSTICRGPLSAARLSAVAC